MGDYRKGEDLDRGLIALRSDEGVYLSWRLLSSDPRDISFNVYREDESGVHKISERPISSTTDLLDRSAQGKSECRYILKSVVDGEEREEASATAEEKGYIRVPFQGNYKAQKVGVGDLDGDGQLEFVIKRPDFNVDPYQHPGYWKPSREPYKLEAYKLDGRMMWRYDMGWAIEEGIWYSPYVVYDLDGDGRAEVYTKAGDCLLYTSPSPRD